MARSHIQVCIRLCSHSGRSDSRQLECQPPFEREARHDVNKHCSSEMRSTNKNDHDLHIYKKHMGRQSQATWSRAMLAAKLSWKAFRAAPCLLSVVLVADWQPAAASSVRSSA